MSKLQIKSTRKYGRGLYATRDIKKGEVVERSPVIELAQYGATINSTVNVYVFGWQSGMNALALGLGSLFNHSSRHPNVTYNPVFQTKEIIFVALKNIKKGSQLFINYGYDPKYGMETTEHNFYQALKKKFEPEEKKPNLLRGYSGGMKDSEEIKSIGDEEAMEECPRGEAPSEAKL